jgi:hypothetical protein
MYTPNVSTPNIMKETLLDIKAQIDLSTKIAGVFNTPLLPIDRTFN